MYQDSPKLIILDKINSTNSYLAEFLGKNEYLPEFSQVLAYEQTQGRGQRGTIWTSEKDKNLTFSIILYPEFLPVTEQFYLSKIIALSILNILNEIKKGFKIKWANDIVFDNKKIVGVLIENSLSGNKIKKSVIGIGLNVNQTSFEGLPDAVSLKQITGRNFQIEKIMSDIVKEIQKNYILLKTRKFTEIDKLYHENLYLYNEKHRFKTSGKIFEGTICGTDTFGKLIVKNNNSKEIKKYSIKEIEFLESL